MNTEYTYIVTGCTGFVGNVLTKKLLEEGCSVVGLARSEQKAVRVFGENAPKMVYGDITDSKAAEELFCGNKPFVVIHTVAKVSIGESSAQELYDVTVNGTKNVVKASLQHDVKKFIHISSTEALPRGMKQGERYIPDPKKSRKGYARTKSEADAVVLRAVAENGLNASILLFALDQAFERLTSSNLIKVLGGFLTLCRRGWAISFDTHYLSPPLSDFLSSVFSSATSSKILMLSPSLRVTKAIFLSWR